MNDNGRVVAAVSEKKNSVVLVRITGGDSTEKKANGRPFSISEGGESSFSGSGIIVDASLGIIITTATLFSPFIDYNKAFGTLQNGTNVFVLTDQMANKDNSKEVSWISAKLLAIRPVTGLMDAILGLLGTLDPWRIGWHVRENNEHVYNSIVQYLDKIAILQISKEDSGLHNISNTKLEKVETAQLQKGESVFSIGTPFGLISPKAMMNSVSIGSICNFISLPSKSNMETNIPLFITDSKCFPGMEGGAIFNLKGIFVGMMLPPLRKKKAHVEFNFAISSESLLQTLLPFLEPSSYHLIETQSQTLLPTLSALSKAEKSVVLVTIEHHWASGFFLSSTGYVVTTAHLLRPFLSSRNECRSRVKIRVDTSPQESRDPVWTWFDAKVIFACLEESHVDAVLLKISAPHFSCVPFPFENSLEYSEGQSIAIIGYPVYVPDDKLRATVTTGIVSKIATIDGKPCLIETTAVVHAGNSGGVLLTKEGRFLGMVTSNAKQIGSNKVIPRINFSIPREELLPFFVFARNEDMNVLRSYDDIQEIKKSLWKLQLRPSLRSVPQPSSKFQSFLQEMEKNVPKSNL